ncbi:hypothetical protein [Streptomyces sp. NPDC102476]|uniref:hypothetical protein n=1 Tax=Streptomyces sp. NPDC102476 TaxID=3366181 RepID=UPI0038199BD7
MRAGPSARNSQGDGLEGGIPRLLLFQSTLIDDKTLRWTMERMQAAASAEGTVEVREGEEVVWRQAAGVPGQLFEVRYGLDSFTWREEGLFELTGTPINPGLHWYLPGRDYGTYYVSQFGSSTTCTRSSTSTAATPSSGWSPSAPTS